MDKYIIKTNVQQFAKAYLLYDIVCHCDITKYIMQIFSKLLLMEYDAVITLLKQIFKLRNWTIEDSKLHYALNNISSILPTGPNMNVLIDPALLAILLQQNHELVLVGNGYFKTKDKIQYHGVEYGIIIHHHYYMFYDFFELLCRRIISHITQHNTWMIEFKIIKHGIDDLFIKMKI